jgi:hypothetical protein
MDSFAAQMRCSWMARSCRAMTPEYGYDHGNDNHLTA